LESLFHLHQPGFSRFVSLSLIVHIVILAIVLFAVQSTQKRIFITPTYTKVNLVAPTVVKKKKKPVKATKQARAKKVAVKKTKPKKKAIAIKKAVTPPPPAIPVKVEKKVSIDDAISKLEKELASEEEDLMVASMIEKLEQKTAEEDIEKEALLEELRSELAAYDEAQKNVSAETPVPDQSQSSANAYEGLSSELFELQFKSYYNKVGAKIQSLWIYPGKAEKTLETLVTIKISRNGALLDYWLERKSGDRIFDESTLKAIEKGAPYPPLPPDYNEESLEIGLRFCPGGCQQ
jgi:TonB family protein